jgi:hypothetical protein
MTVYEESVCTYCETLHDCPLGEALRGPKREVVCTECYKLFEYQDIDRALLNIREREKVSLKRLAERIQVLIIAEEK